MDPKQIIDMISFIKGDSRPKLVVESNAHAEPLAKVIFESKVLYDMLHGKYNLDQIVEQISKKNQAAKEYQKVTGIKWPF
tara:strand:- start:24 stop:263 length:240 start_codon:yes stop_codon:yes gene_type:complete